MRFTRSFAIRRARSRGYCVAAALLTASVTYAASPPPVTLYYWGSAWDAVSFDIVQGFETSHNGSDGKQTIKVVMGQAAQINNVDDPQRLLTAVAGGDPPDVVWFNRYAVPGMAARGSFESLQEFFERDLRERPNDPMTLHPDQFFAACWADVNFDGQIYAIPADTDNRALYYNLDLFEKHSAELVAAWCVDASDPAKPGPPRNWDQLKRCASILTEYDSRGRLQTAGFIPNFGNSWLYLYSWLNGGAFMSPDGRKCTLNDSKNVEALVFMCEIYDMMGGAEAVNAFQIGLQAGDLDPFLSGQIAMRVDGDGFMNTIATQRRDLRFGVVLTPAPKGHQSLGWSAGWCWVIPKGAKHPAEAWEFIKHLASRRAYEIRANALRQVAQAGGRVFIPWFSARRDITEWALSHYLYNDPSIEEKYRNGMRVFFDGMSHSEHLPITPVGQLLWSAQVRAMEGGIYKRYDKDDIRRNAQIALDMNTVTVQSELDRFYAPKAGTVIPWRFIVWGYILVTIAMMGGMYWHFNRSTQCRGYFRREAGAGYVFATPWFLGFIVFGGGPILFSLLMSFSEYDMLSPPRFVGFQNYSTIFTGDPLFYKSLMNTLFMALGIPLGIVVGLGIAILLNHDVKGMALYRTFFYLPAILPAVAGAILWIWIFNPREGILNTLLSVLGVSGPSWLQDPNWSKPALILMGLWGVGGSMIIWIAGLKSIPNHLYEVAELDGATPYRKFVSITLPMLSPYILFNLIVGVIGTFQMFSQPFIMTQGGPVDSTLVYTYYLFNNAFRYLKMGYASALAWILLSIVLILTLIQLRLSRNWVYYESDQ